MAYEGLVHLAGCRSGEDEHLADVYTNLSGAPLVERQS